MATKSQTPAPKVSSEKDISKQSSGILEKKVATAEKGATKKTDATKTPQKIQDGKTGQKKTEY